MLKYMYYKGIEGRTQQALHSLAVSIVNFRLPKDYIVLGSKNT
jgi:hypothetical protein